MSFAIYRDHATPLCMSRVDTRCLSDSPLVFWNDDEDTSDSGLGSPLSDLERLLLSPDAERRSRRSMRSRRRLFTNKRQRGESPEGGNSSEEEESVCRKRRRYNAPLTPTLSRQSGETTETLSGNLHDGSHFIGDGSCVHTLPVVKGPDDGVARVHHYTIADVLRGRYEAISEFQMIDCRYPYEFLGGHIEGAINIFTEEGMDAFLQHINTQTTTKVGKRVVVLYSESFDRGSKLLQYLRSADRKLNIDRYPHLFYPEIYLLHAGYSEFFQHHKKLCCPLEHVQKLDRRHYRELRHFRCNEQRKTKDLKRERNAKLQNLSQSPLF